MDQYLEYAAQPGSNVPQALPRQRLAVLSPIWRAPPLTLEYPDGDVHTLVGWSGSAPGEACGLQVFLTQPTPATPAGCGTTGPARVAHPARGSRSWPWPRT
jgi:hypothetical protein